MWAHCFNLVVWFKEGTNTNHQSKEPDPKGDLVHIWHNLMSGYHADYNKCYRLAAQLMLEKPGLLTDPEEKAKVR
jgi:hypothetical protein